jgi:hypothetical protein
MSSLRYREVQKFRQPWVWCLVLGSAGLMLWIFGYGIVQQMVHGRPWGNNPMSDTGLVVTALISLSVSLGLVWLFLAMSLEVQVRSDGVFLHFKPLKRRTIAYSEIASVEAVQYRPVVHYGGWGIRRGRHGWAYNVSGNTGVRLDFHDNKHFLIGSQRHIELASAIETEMRR